MHGHQQHLSRALVCLSTSWMNLTHGWCRSPQRGPQHMLELPGCKAVAAVRCLSEPFRPHPAPRPCAPAHPFRRTAGAPAPPAAPQRRCEQRDRNGAPPRAQTTRRPLQRPWTPLRRRKLPRGTRLAGRSPAQERRDGGIPYCQQRSYEAVPQLTARKPRNARLKQAPTSCLRVWCPVTSSAAKGAHSPCQSRLPLVLADARNAVVHACSCRPHLPSWPSCRTARPGACSSRSPAAEMAARSGTVYRSIHRWIRHATSPLPLGPWPAVRGARAGGSF